MPIPTKIKCFKCGKSFISGDALSLLCPKCNGNKGNFITELIKSILSKIKVK